MAETNGTVSTLSLDGYCPICECDTQFSAVSDKFIPKAYEGAWLRGALRCSKCKSPPRERAIAHFLNKTRPNWRELSIHESSPGGWAFSYKLRRECPNYHASQYDPTFAFGEMHESGRWRNENLEAQTFQDEVFDIVVTQDVFEHLFHPGRAAREIARTLKPGGLCLMTVPVVNPWGAITRRAELRDGEVHHLLPEQYHGNPVGDGRSLVTVDWSYAIGAYLSAQSGLPFAVHVIDDMSMGIRDSANVVLTAVKEPLPDLGE
jgi:SAM-dependent methyltransferase